jgi:Na+/H+-dicarboxylate symporter/ABC-type amino acid transport substrate-binding protein
MTFSRKILVGLALGILVGLFFGEHALALKWAADGYVKLLQMTVLPYVTVSIIESLGSLGAAEARRLGLRAGLVLAALWLIALTYAMLVPLMFPTVETAAFFSTTLLEHRPPFNFVDLYIPANPFHSLANNIVPAVVLFSIVLGVAVIGLERKPVLLDLLHVVSAALSRATRFIVQLTPYGLFAIAATAAGTLSLEQLGRLQVYLVAYVGVALLVSLWVLPGLVAALTPIRVRDIFSLTRNALITAFVAGDLFIVLPALIEASRTLVDRAGVGTARSDLPEVIVPASFNFPHTGKLLSISFILFAGWFADAELPLAEYPRLALTGLVTLFGSVNVAVPFMLDLFRIPADTFQLFLASGVINSRFGTLVATMHTLAVALLGTCAMAGTLTWDRRRVVRYAVITAVLTAGFIGGGRMLFGRAMYHEYSKDKVLAGMHLMRDPVRAVVHKAPPAAATPMAASETGSRLDIIRRRGVLTVGYMPDALPYAFFNAAGDLVGLDVELAHRLASELNVGLEFVPVERERLAEHLEQGDCDLIMSGIPVTTLRASRMLFSTSYQDETLAFIVPDRLRTGFAAWDQIAARPALRLGMPDIPYYVQFIRERLPRAEIVFVTEVSSFLAERQEADFDAIVLTAERGSAWTLMYPKFSVAIPEPGLVKVPLAYPVAQRDEEFASFVNTWIELKRKDGTLDALYKYWILGHDAAPKQPRWSIMRNVLHWTK